MAFTQRSYPFNRKQEGGDGFWQRRCEIAPSRKLRSRVPRVPTYLHRLSGTLSWAKLLLLYGKKVMSMTVTLWPFWKATLAAALTPSSSITTTTFRGLPGRTTLRLFLEWPCQRSPADWQRLVYTLEKLRDFASASHSYLLLEIFHTGTNEGIIQIMRHIE